MELSKKAYKLINDINFELHKFQKECKEKDILTAFSLSVNDGIYQIDVILIEDEVDDDD